MDDVTPGSWYIVPLPSFREARDRVSTLPEVSIYGRIFGTIVCLFAVLSVFILTLLLQRSVVTVVAWITMKNR